MRGSRKERMGGEERRERMREGRGTIVEEQIKGGKEVEEKGNEVKMERERGKKKKTR